MGVVRNEWLYYCKSKWINCSQCFYSLDSKKKRIDSLFSSQNKILCPQIQSESICSNCLITNTNFCLKRLALVVDALNQLSSFIVYLYNLVMFTLPKITWALRFWPLFACPLLFTRMHRDGELPLKWRWPWLLLGVCGVKPAQLVHLLSLRWQGKK